MKKQPIFLLSAGFLAWLLAGCASPSGEMRTSGHTLETRRVTELPLPFLNDDQTGAALFSQTFSEPVQDLDKPGVLERLGRPVERLSPDLWIYWRYHAPEIAAENGGHDTLVVAFARGRVRAMKLVRGDALRAYLASAWQPRPELARQ